MSLKFSFRAAIVLLVFIIASSLKAQQQKGGSEFYEEIREMTFEERESAILKEFEKGNFPDFLLDWKKITIRQKDASGNYRLVNLFVSPDYLSIGNKEDYFIIPLGPKTAQKIAEQFEASLPTPKIVDIIYQNAELKVEPFNYIPRGNRNETVDIFYDHSRVIRAQMNAAGFHPGVFIAGSKKDIVISHKLADPGRTHHVSIYGWHKLNTLPIQPLYNGHVDTYVDYSHGVRLISNRVLIDGKEYRYREVLQDENLFKLLSYGEGPLKNTSYAH